VVNIDKTLCACYLIGGKLKLSCDVVPALMLALTMLCVDENHMSMFGQLSDFEIGLAGEPV